MNRILLVLTFVCFGSFILTFMQNDYIMKQQFGEIEYYNKSACEYVRVQNVKLNRTFLAYTFRVHTLIDWDGDSFKMNIKGFRFENNLFRHKIFDFDLKICESFRKNYIGLSNLLKQGNLTECPIKKGYYVINNFIVDDRKLPPFLPAGRYRIQVVILYHRYIMTMGSTYVEIIYKVKY